MNIFTFFQLVSTFPYGKILIAFVLLYPVLEGTAYGFLLWQRGKGKIQFPVENKNIQMAYTAFVLLIVSIFVWAMRWITQSDFPVERFIMLCFPLWIYALLVFHFVVDAVRRKLLK